MDPAPLEDAAADLGRAATRLGREYAQYQRHVLSPLDRAQDWSGGGQPDACVVATVNGLAIDTMRMRVNAGNIAVATLAAGLTTAQQQMAARNRAVDADGYDIDANGVITTLPAGNPTVTGAGTPVAKIQEHERRRNQILAFATDVDRDTAAALRRSDEPPVTSLYATPGLLARARRDHANAASDLTHTVSVLFDTARAAKTLAASADQDSIGVDLLEGLADMTDQQRDELTLAIATLTAGTAIVILGAGLAAGGAGITAGSGGGLAIAGIPATAIGATATRFGAAAILTGTTTGAKTLHDIYSEARSKANSSNVRKHELPPRPPATKPRVSDPKLRNILNNLYKGASENNAKRVGDGTTADAVRSEFASGRSTKDTWHLHKAGIEMRALQGWLKNNRGTNARDEAVAEAELENLIAALNGH